MSLDLIPVIFSVILDLISVFDNSRSYSCGFSRKPHFVVATGGHRWPPVGKIFLPPVATGGPPLATTKCVITTAVATGGAAMGSAVATGGLPWVVSTGPVICKISPRKTQPPSAICSIAIFDAEFFDLLRN